MPYLAELIEDIVLLRSYSGPKCTMYSVRKPNQDATEFYQWLTKFAYLNQKEGREKLQLFEIAQNLDHFKKYGVSQQDIRAEQGAGALSTRPNSLPAIRLYVIKMSENVLILLNGGLKTEIDPKRCLNVQAHFNFAVSLAKAIDKERDSLIVQNNQLISPDGTINIT